MFPSIITFLFIGHRDDHCWPLLHITYYSSILCQSFCVNKIHSPLAKPGSTAFVCELSRDWVVHYIPVPYWIQAYYLTILQIVPNLRMFKIIDIWLLFHFHEAWKFFIENVFSQYILVCIPLPQLLPDPPWLTIYPNPHPFSFSLEYKQISHNNKVKYKQTNLSGMKQTKYQEKESKKKHI